MLCAASWLGIHTYSNRGTISHSPGQIFPDQVEGFYDCFPKNRTTPTGFLGVSDPFNQSAWIDVFMYDNFGPQTNCGD